MPDEWKVEKSNVGNISIVEAESMDGSALLNIATNNLDYDYKSRLNRIGGNFEDFTQFVKANITDPKSENICMGKAVSGSPITVFINGIKGFRVTYLCDNPDVILTWIALIDNNKSYLMMSAVSPNDQFNANIINNICNSFNVM